MIYNFNDADQREAAMAAKWAECCEENTSLRQQLASRDAEVAELKSMVNEIQAAKHVQREHNDLLVKNNQLREQVTLLRDGLKRADDLLRHSYDHVSPLIREALAATEPK